MWMRAGCTGMLRTQLEMQPVSIEDSQDLPLPPSVFAQEMARRSYNQTTATIEEITPSTPRGSAAPAKVPMSTPDPTFSVAAGSSSTVTAAAPASPRSAPQSFGPQVAPEQVTQEAGTKGGAEDV